MSSLRDCISEFEKEEFLKGDNMWMCSTCNEKRESMKKLSIQVKGCYFFIHLKRFSFDGDKVDKDHSMIKFPSSFDASSYKENSNNLEFKLVAAIQTGEAHSGVTILLLLSTMRYQ